jgi:hypothetical protein
MEAVIPEINKFAQKVNAKIFDRPYADTEFAYIPKGYQMAPGYDSRVSPLNPLFTQYGRMGVEELHFWRSKKFRSEVRGMDVGDVTGDGKNELVLLEGTDVRVYAYDKGGLRQVASHPSSTRDPFTAVDVADINGNGRAEIFASRLSDTTIKSAVLELEGRELKPVVKEAPFFFRVMSWPGKGTLLLGQEKRIGGRGGSVIRDYFDRGIWALSWDGEKGRYVKSGEAPLLDLPNVFIFNFAIGDLSGDNVPEIVMIDRRERLRILDVHGAELHRDAEEYYGGTLNYIVTNPYPSEASDRKIDEVWLFIPARILIADLDKDGRNEIITNKNRSTTEGYTERFKAYSSGKIVSLTWSGLGLDLNWESRKLSGVLTDYQVKDLDNDDNPDLVVSLLKKRKVSMMQKPQSIVMSYKLTVAEEE